MGGALGKGKIKNRKLKEIKVFEHEFSLNRQHISNSSYKNRERKKKMIQKKNEQINKA